VSTRDAITKLIRVLERAGGHGWLVYEARGRAAVVTVVDELDDRSRRSVTHRGRAHVNLRTVRTAWRKGLVDWRGPVEQPPGEVLPKVAGLGSAGLSTLTDVRAYPVWLTPKEDSHP
jgi:hypothetical protein